MDYFLFLTICAVATFSPGPAVLLTMKNSAQYGFCLAISGILGNITAMITMSGLSATGVGVLLATSESLFLFIKVFGGIYLVFLGLKTWFSNTPTLVPQKHQVSTPNRKTLFIEAYLVGSTNPKAVIFYSALFPQFIDVEQSMVPQFVFLTLTFASLSFLALLMYALVANQLKVLLVKGKLKTALNKVTGGLLIGLGFSLIVGNKAVPNV